MTEVCFHIGNTFVTALRSCWQSVNHLPVLRNVRSAYFFNRCDLNQFLLYRQPFSFFCFDKLYYFSASSAFCHLSPFLRFQLLPELIIQKFDVHFFTHNLHCLPFTKLKNPLPTAKFTLAIGRGLLMPVSLSRPGT